jgi:hypothetical protein
MHLNRSFHPLSILVSFAVSTLAFTAHAQPEGPAPGATADKLWEEAGKAMDAHDYATACPKIEEVIRLRPDGLGAKLKLAKCYEGAGRLASAWSLYVRVESLAEKASQPDRQKVAHDRVEALKSALATLMIIVPDAVRAQPGTAVTCDDKVVEPAQWGVPLPVDKGRHVIVVTATATERSERVEEIEADGAHKTITIAPPTGVNVTPPATPPESKPPESKRSVVPTVVLAVLAAGGIGSGIGLLVASRSNNLDAEALAKYITANRGDCMPNVASNAGVLCTQLQGYVNRHITYENAAVGTFIAGGAAAAGTALYLLWPSPRATTAGPSVAYDIRLTPILAPTVNGLLVSGQF